MPEDRNPLSDFAQTAPSGILLIIAITLVFEAAFLSSVNEQAIPDYNFSDPANETGFSFGDVFPIISILDAVWQTILLFIDLLTFNIPGAPNWIRFIMATGLTGSLAWSIASLIRG